MMHAQYSQRGPAPHQVIEAVEFSLPPPGPGQALIEVLAAPINPSDVLTLTGEYGMLPPLPAVGGNEGVGRVLELGPDTKGPKPGQIVLLPVGCGTWSTHVMVEAARLMPLPNEADPQQLSMMTVNPPTAKLLLEEFVSLEPGDWVIQNAANSGVGAYLVQLAKLRGLRSINIVRRESALAAVRDLGGDIVLVDGDKLAKRVAEATGGARIKLGIDAVGGGATDRLAAALGDGAVLVNYGAMSGEACQLSPAALVFRNINLRGFWLSRWFKQASAERRMAVFGEIATLIAQGKLQARVHATYPIERIKEAVAAAAAGEREGKILVIPSI
jgi:NADPH:quinone reductase-like Zn-dependent oxidoreductase